MPKCVPDKLKRNPRDGVLRKSEAFLLGPHDGPFDSGEVCSVGPYCAKDIELVYIGVQMRAHIRGPQENPWSKARGIAPLYSNLRITWKSSCCLALEYATRENKAMAGGPKDHINTSILQTMGSGTPFLCIYIRM